jgi:hypothetical protein
MILSDEFLSAVESIDIISATPTRSLGNISDSSDPALSTAGTSSGTTTPTAIANIEMATDAEGEKHPRSALSEGQTPSAPSPTELAPPTAEPPSEQPQDNTPDVPAKYTIYTQWQKRLIVAGASIAALFSPLTAQIYMPALNALAADFNVTASQINLTVTTFMIFQGITPMFIGGLADTAGRRPAYGICFVVFLAANVGLALSRNYVSLLVVRCIQSAGSSTTVALCQAVVADIVTSAERGQYIGITIIPVVIGPSLGPVIGGLLTQYLG